MVANENGKKKGLAWLKSSFFSQSSTDVENVEKEEIRNEERAIAMKENEQITQQSNNVFAKDNQDKIILDLIVPLENLIKDRQLIQYKNKGLEEQIYAANETINRMKQDLVKKDQQIQEKNKEIRNLEANLTSKQMNYDQLLEDYKEYQSTSNMEYETISNQLSAEINKYNKLSEEAKNSQYQNMLKIGELEEKVRSLEIENQQNKDKYQRAFDEKTELIKTINDFTQRMTFSLSPKAVDSSETE
ncbi:MAG: hypothetical protein M0Q14_05870 [Tissierellaceae bacterium]|nr:hypothetical protein [Tissierellaceae bacterium]